VTRTDQLCATIRALADRHEELCDQGRTERAARIAIELRALRLSLLRERWARRDKRRDRPRKAPGKAQERRGG
jgi:hypothetical protein